MTVISGIAPRFGQLYQIKIRDYEPEPIPRKPGSEKISPDYVQYKPMSPELSKLVDLGKTRLCQALNSNGIKADPLELDLVATRPFMRTFQKRLDSIIDNIRESLPAPGKQQHLVEESPVLKRHMQVRRWENEAQLDTLLETDLQPYPVFVAPKGMYSVEFSVPPTIKVSNSIISAPTELVEALGSISEPRPLLTRQSHQ